MPGKGCLQPRHRGQSADKKTCENGPAGFGLSSGPGKGRPQKGRHRQQEEGMNAEDPEQGAGPAIEFREIGRGSGEHPSKKEPEERQAESCCDRAE